MSSGARRVLVWALVIAVLVVVVEIAFRKTHSTGSGQRPGPEVLTGIASDCPMEGDARTTALRQLNRLKNRLQPPDSSRIDPRVTLQAMTVAGPDEDRWDEQRGAEVTGYVTGVRTGGIESCNCHARDPQGRDSHIELVVDPGNYAVQRRVIVEVTPSWRRAAAQRLGVDWSTRTLRATLRGHWVRVRGWMLYDWEHADRAENTAPGNPQNWRATAWEIHPVTSIEVLPGPPPKAWPAQAGSPAASGRPGGSG